MKIKIIKPLRLPWKKSKEKGREESKKFYKNHREQEIRRSCRYAKENKDVINLKQRLRYRNKKLKVLVQEKENLKNPQEELPPSQLASV